MIDPILLRSHSIRVLVQSLFLWLANLQMCLGCSGTFQRLNNVEGTAMCDECFRKRSS